MFRVKSFKNNAENKITATAFLQVSRISETQGTQNDKATQLPLPLSLSVSPFAQLARSLCLCRYIFFAFFKLKLL
jgi:hypothetical protein